MMLNSRYDIEVMTGRRSKANAPIIMVDPITGRSITFAGMDHIEIVLNVKSDTGIVDSVQLIVGVMNSLKKSDLGRNFSRIGDM